jgi:excinuclease ABC subunit C
VLKDGALYYGPFASADALKKAKRLIHKVFPLRTVRTRNSEALRASCLSYYMGVSRTVRRKVDEAGYNEVVRLTRMFLRGGRQDHRIAQG